VVLDGLGDLGLEVGLEVGGGVGVGFGGRGFVGVVGGRAVEELTELLGEVVR
jgi:hypothetical protein